MPFSGLPMNFLYQIVLGIIKTIISQNLPAWHVREQDQSSFPVDCTLPTRALAFGSVDIHDTKENP
jgi:hypothetical protein